MPKETAGSYTDPASGRSELNAEFREYKEDLEKRDNSGGRFAKGGLAVTAILILVALLLLTTILPLVAPAVVPAIGAALGLPAVAVPAAGVLAAGGLGLTGTAIMSPMHAAVQGKKASRRLDGYNPEKRELFEQMNKGGTEATRAVDNYLAQHSPGAQSAPRIGQATDFSHLAGNQNSHYQNPQNIGFSRRQQNSPQTQRPKRK